MCVQGWWAFDALTLMSTYLGRVVTQAQTILSVLGVLTFMIPTAFNIAGAVLLGNSIGVGSAKLVQHYYKWSLRAAFLIVAI